MKNRRKETMMKEREESKMRRKSNSKIEQELYSLQPLKRNRKESRQLSSQRTMIANMPPKLK